VTGARLTAKVQLPVTTMRALLVSRKETLRKPEIAARFRQARADGAAKPDVRTLSTLLQNEQAAAWRSWTGGRVCDAPGASMNRPGGISGPAGVSWWGSAQPSSGQNHRAGWWPFRLFLSSRNIHRREGRLSPASLFPFIGHSFPTAFSNRGRRPVFKDHVSPPIALVAIKTRVLHTNRCMGVMDHAITPRGGLGGHGYQRK